MRPADYDAFAERLRKLGADVPDRGYYQTDDADAAPILSAIIKVLEDRSLSEYVAAEPFVPEVTGKL